MRLMVVLTMSAQVDSALVSQPVPDSAQPAVTAQPDTAVANASQPIDVGLRRLTPEQEYDLLKLQIMAEMQSEITQWAQRRFWFMAVLIVVVGFIGIRAFVRDLITSELREAIKAAGTAQAAADQAREVTKEVKAEATDYRKKVDELRGVASEVRKSLDGVKTRIEAESNHAIATSDLKILALSKRLDELSLTVQQLATDSEAARYALGEYRQRILKLDEHSAEQASDFRENAEYSVTVVHHESKGSPSERIASVLIPRLSSVGFRAGSGIWGESSGEHPEVEIAYHPGDDKVAERILAEVRSIMEEMGDDRPSYAYSRHDYDSNREIEVFL